jgi:eukaryotic-like serine/threonine-protein kinase
MSVAAPASGLPRLAKYELLEEIGHGGMATVYRARDKRLGREVAVKLIHRHLRENAEVGARFIAEARAAAKLRHPGIVEVHDVSSEDDGERYLVVELIRGCTLRQVLKDHRQMPAEIGAAIVLELCAALEHAHAASIIHRDIKPENVLVEIPDPKSTSPRPSSRPPRLSGGASAPRASQPSATRLVAPSEPDASGRSARAADMVTIKLTDFGIAKILDAQGVTSTGQVLGSPAHMAPEQIEAGDVDAHTDVFGVGVLFYECLVGHLPFEGKNPAQVLRKVLEGVFPQADRERPTVGGRWARIVAKALAHDPKQRTASPGLLAEKIRGELEALGITAPRAEIAAYFADPEGYAAALTQQLVPALIARGEAARRDGDVEGAAADVNRALAFCPNDLALMKRVRSLSGAAGRRLLLRRAAMVALGSLALGCAAFGVTRAVKATWTGKRAPDAPFAAGAAGLPEPSPSSLAAAPAPRETPEAPSATALGATPQASPPASASPSSPHRLTRVPAQPTVGNGAPSATSRIVKFVVTPPGAKLVVDGQPVSWFGGPVSLPTGVHQITTFMEGSRCCKPLTQPVVVEPPKPGALDGVQTIALALQILPTSVVLANAPSTAQFTCPAIYLSGLAGTPVTVRLNEPEWSGRCQFMASSDGAPRSVTVVLRAGDTNTLTFPAD